MPSWGARSARARKASCSARFAAASRASYSGSSVRKRLREETTLSSRANAKSRNASLAGRTVLEISLGVFDTRLRSTPGIMAKAISEMMTNTNAMRGSHPPDSRGGVAATFGRAGTIGIRFPVYRERRQRARAMSISASPCGGSHVCPASRLPHTYILTDTDL